VGGGKKTYSIGTSIDARTISRQSISQGSISLIKLEWVSVAKKRMFDFFPPPQKFATFFQGRKKRVRFSGGKKPIFRKDFYTTKFCYYYYYYTNRIICSRGGIVYNNKSISYTVNFYHGIRFCCGRVHIMLVRKNAPRYCGKNRHTSSPSSSSSFPEPETSIHAEEGPLNAFRFCSFL